MKKKQKSLIGIVVLVLLMCLAVAVTAFAEKKVDDVIPLLNEDKAGMATPSEAVPSEEEENVVDEEEIEDETASVENKHVRVATDSNAEFIPVEGAGWAVGDNSYEGVDYPGWGTWDKEQLTEEQKEKVLFITARIFRNGEELGRFESDNYSDYADYRMYFNEPGDYTFQAVYQMADNIQDVKEDDWSELSEPYTYERVGKAAPVPTNLTWGEDGTMNWDDVNHKQNYLVRVYKKNNEGSYRSIDFTVTNKNHVSRVHKFDDPNATYKFTVTSIGDLKEFDNSEESPMSKPFFVGDATEQAKGIINDIMNSGDIKNAVENAEITADERDAMKLAIQADEEVAENLKELEEKYKSETGKEFDVVSESEMVDSSQVSIVGGALNGAESINFKSADVDKTDFDRYKTVIGLNISLNGSVETGDLKYPVLITMPVPKGIYVQKLVIYHYAKDGSVLEQIVPRINGDGTISFAVTNFSDFAFIDTTPAEDHNNGGTSGGEGSSSGGGGSSSSGRRTTVKTDPLETVGTWIQDKDGWWFKKFDGTYPVSAWLMNGGNWFRFDEKGYMVTGWYTDTDGKKYYLNPVSDGTQGAMKLGWQLIDGKWYYFNLVSDGTRGALLTNTTTPDGYPVNADGVWTQ